MLLLWEWRPLGGVVWQVEDGFGRAALFAISAAGWGLVLLATFLINHFDLFGLRQAWFALQDRRYLPVPLATPWLYRVERHPLYLGFLIAFWAAPTMTLAHLVFAIATSAYILIAIQLEERDLVAEHGPGHETYRRRVPMLLPGARPAARHLLILIVPAVA